MSDRQQGGEVPAVDQGVAGEPARVAATVTGQVQGVGFRWFVIREGSRLGLVGWVANASDGSVRLEAEGDPRSVDRFIALVREGPPGAHVEAVSTDRLAALGTESRFEVRSRFHPGD